MAIGKGKKNRSIISIAFEVTLNNKIRIMKIKCLLLILVVFSFSVNAQETDKTAYSIKYDFFTPVAGCFGFSLELPRTNFTSLDIDAGLIGLQLGDYYFNDKFGGAYAAVGPRFYFRKDDLPKNDMRGPYFKPQILLNYFQYEYESDYFDPIMGTSFTGLVTGSDFSANVLLCMGSQWVLSDIIVFDLWFGLGYGGDWVSEETDVPPEYFFDYGQHSYKYSHLHFGNSPMVFDGGLSIGLIF